VYVGSVPENTLLDATGSYRLRPAYGGAIVSVSATNLLDKRVPTFVGVPAVGRLVMLRVQYTF
jgi:iron complex outermembrane receptor protein